MPQIKGFLMKCPICQTELILDKSRYNDKPAYECRPTNAGIIPTIHEAYIEPNGTWWVIYPLQNHTFLELVYYPNEPIDQQYSYNILNNSFVIVNTLFIEPLDFQDAFDTIQRYQKLMAFS